MLRIPVHLSFPVILNCAYRGSDVGSVKQVSIALVSSASLSPSPSPLLFHLSFYILSLSGLVEVGEADLRSDNPALSMCRRWFQASYLCHLIYFTHQVCSLCPGELRGTWVFYDGQWEGRKQWKPLGHWPARLQRDPDIYHPWSPQKLFPESLPPECPLNLLRPLPNPYFLPLLPRPGT